MAFTLNRHLLNPHFEGYKLSFALSPKLLYVPLQHKLSQSRTGTRALGFQDVFSRVRHNHLAVSESIDFVLYVADDGNVVLISIDDELVPADGGGEQKGATLSVVFRLPSSVTAPQKQAEYPAAVHVTHNLWLVSDGNGNAYLIRIDHSPANNGYRGQLLSRWQLQTDKSTTPFQLHTVGLVSDTSALAILSSPESSSDTLSKTTQFDIWAVRIQIADSSQGPAMAPDEKAAPFEIAWRHRGSHIPIFAKYISAHQTFLFLGGSRYRDESTATPQGPYEPSPDEIAPIPRPGENLDMSTPAPYSWTQTDDTVTIAFALPGPTPKSSIVSSFKSNSLSLRVGNPLLPRPLYTDAPLWDAIHPSSSLWTWERGELSKAGLLTLHLDKLHVGTRWSHVFAQGFEANEVPETVDPSELANIRETLDKYTAGVQDGASGLGRGVPSLAAGERDIEVDADVGNLVELTWVGVDGQIQVPTDDSPVVLLSLPLPGVPGPVSLVIKHDIDGPLFTLTDAHAWSHDASYPALAFVLASKRDTRFTFHISSTLALAFDSGARNDGGGNVYLYQGSTPDDKWAKQNVFQMFGGGGPLLGVGAVTSLGGKTSLLCLSERGLTICRDPP